MNKFLRTVSFNTSQLFFTFVIDCCNVRLFLRQPLLLQSVIIPMLRRSLANSISIGFKVKRCFSLLEDSPLVYFPLSAYGTG